MSRRTGESKPKAWDKDGPSPNPGGRPRKNRLASILPRKLHPWAIEILEFDQGLTGLHDSENNEFTFGSAFLHNVWKRSFTDYRYAVLFAGMRREAYAADSEFRFKLIEAVNDHKARYLEASRKAAKSGRPMPKVYPDPRYMDVTPDGDVWIGGPADEAEQRHLQAVIARRDLFLRELNDIVVVDPAERDELVELRNYMRRQIYKLNPLIPKHLRKRIPPLRESED